MPQVLILAAIFLLCCQTGGRTEDGQEISLSQQAIEGIAPFGAVVERNWQRWSRGSDTVVKLDLIAQYPNPEYRGEDAAALVALETWLRKAGTIDRASALALQDPRILRIYHGNVLKLRDAKRVLYANGKPTFELLQQGPPGDCYFFAGTGWMALYRWEIIMKTIRELTGGRYEVVFPNGDRAIVDAPTDAELANNDSVSTLRDGLWMPVLEKATGTIQARNIKKSAALPDPTVAIDIPGVPIASIVERWTGKNVLKFTLGRRAHREKVREALIRMHKHNSLAEVLLLHKPPAKLPYDHVYAVLGFDSATDTVKIWNPWGTDFTPNGPSGPENGYERKNGVFSLALDEFIDFYSFLAIEENSGRL